MRTLLVAHTRKLLLLGVLLVVGIWSLPASAMGPEIAQPAPATHHAIYPLPIGDWSMNANGFTGPGPLHIGGVDVAGNLVGSTLFGDPIEGFYDRASQRIQFLRLDVAGQKSTSQVFEGFLFHNPLAPVAGQPILYTLAGSFTAFRGTGAIPTRGEYGWYAQIRKICCPTAGAQ